jgi:O-antigen/teichoic acid export membrane protein
MRLVYGNQFVQGGNIVFLFSLTILAMAITLPSTIAFSVARRADINVLVNAIALAVHLLAGVCLTAQCGAVGAAYGLLAGSAVAASVRFVLYGRACGGQS